MPKKKKVVSKELEYELIEMMIATRHLSIDRFEKAALAFLEKYSTNDSAESYRKVMNAAHSGPIGIAVGFRDRL